MVITPWKRKESIEFTEKGKNKLRQVRDYERKINEKNERKMDITHRPQRYAWHLFAALILSSLRRRVYTKYFAISQPPPNVGFGSYLYLFGFATELMAEWVNGVRPERRTQTSIYMK